MKLRNVLLANLILILTIALAIIPTGNVFATVATTPKIPIKKEEINSINVFINTNKFLSAPIKESDIIGTLTVFSANDVLFSTNLTANTTINKKTLKDYLNIFVKNYSMILDHSCNFIN